MDSAYLPTLLSNSSASMKFLNLYFFSRCLFSITCQSGESCFINSWISLSCKGSTPPWQGRHCIFIKHAEFSFFSELAARHQCIQKLLLPLFIVLSLGLSFEDSSGILPADISGISDLFSQERAAPINNSSKSILFHLYMYRNWASFWSLRFRANGLETI